MANKLQYLTPAYNDLEAIVKKHLNEVGVLSAKKIYLTIKDSIDRLKDFPLIGQTHPDPLLAKFSFRKLVISKRYVAVYKIINDVVYIYRIVDARTDYPKLITDNL